METLKRLGPYIGMAIGFLTVFFLYRQHCRQEKQFVAEMELTRLQLDELRRKHENLTT